MKVTLKASDLEALGAAAELVEVVDENGTVVGRFTSYVSKSFHEATLKAMESTDYVDSEEVWKAFRRIASEETNR